MGKTSIEWTRSNDGSLGETWNPVRGCQIVSSGCTNCYAMKQAHRFSGKGQPYEGLTKMSKSGPIWTGAVRTVPEALDAPLHWKKPRRVFVNSMSDLFHPDVPDEFIERVLTTTVHAQRHVFQILTKRPERMRELMRRWTDMNGQPQQNLWLGVSVEDQATADERIPLLLETPAAVRWISAEPLLSAIDLTQIKRSDGWVIDALRGVYSKEHHATSDCPGAIEEHGGGPRLDWVVCGGESGPRARPCKIMWIESIRDACSSASVACFIKQLGEDPRWSGAQSSPIEPSRGKNSDPSEWPKDLRIRQFPR